MKLPRRHFLHLAAGAAALPALSRIAWAQSYPKRPVHRPDPLFHNLSFCESDETAFQLKSVIRLMPGLRQGKLCYLTQITSSRTLDRRRRRDRAR